MVTRNYLLHLEPHEILQKLGFKIGADGVDINDDHTAFHDQCLKIIGETIDINQIPAEIFDKDFIKLAKATNEAKTYTHPEYIDSLATRVIILRILRSVYQYNC